MTVDRGTRLRMWWRRARRAVLAGAATILVLFGAGEAYFRATEPNGIAVWQRLFVPSRDAAISRLMRPNARLTYTGTLARLPETVLATNVDGFRGRPFADADAARGPRVVALGASLIFGEGVADPDTIPSRIESRLRADGPGCDARTFNLGIPGIDLAAMLRLLERHGPTLRPDLIVAAAWPEAVPEARVASPVDAIGGAAYVLVAGSKAALGRAIGRGLFITLQSGVPRVRGWLGLGSAATPDEIERARRAVAPAFRRLAAMARGWDSRVVVILFCPGAPRYGVQAVRGAFLAEARARAWDVVDTDALGDPADPSWRVSRWDIHPSAKACRSIADAICATPAARSVAAKCLPGPPPR